MRAHKLAVLERNTNYAAGRIDRLSKEMRQSLIRTIAYREVIAEKTFSKITDHKARLNGRYTQYALRHDITEQIKKLDPTSVRERNAKMRIDHEMGVMNGLIERNLRTILSPRMRERKRLLRELNLERASTFGSISSDGESRSGSAAVTAATKTPAAAVTTKTHAPAAVSRQNTTGVVVTKASVKNKTKEPKSVKLPPLNLNTSRSIVDSPRGVRVKLPPISVTTVR